MRFAPASALKIQLLGCTRNPVKICYSAFQISIDPNNRFTLWNERHLPELTTSAMLRELPDSIKNLQKEKLKRLHFVFFAENISHKGISELRRYHQITDLEKYLQSGSNDQPEVNGFLTPESFAGNKRITKRWNKLQKEMHLFYKYCLENGIAHKEIEPCLPTGALATGQYSMSFQTLQYFLENGMCREAFPEVRELSWQIYDEMKKEFPSLAQKLGVKCWENRRLFCDEKPATYHGCKYSKSRPHRNDLSGFWNKSNSALASQKPMPA